MHILKSKYRVIGILGGGQLAEMLSHPARMLGFTVFSMVKKLQDALPGLKENAITGDWDNPTEALNFAEKVDIVTLENEFVNQKSLEMIENKGIPLVPSMESIALIQDKWHQKQSLINAGIPVVPCEIADSPEHVLEFAKAHGWPVVLKRRHFGYDGKGNATVKSASELQAAWTDLTVNASGLYVEAFCPFERELAVMVCRSTHDETAVYPVVDTVQRNHICHIVRAPSSITDDLAGRVRQLAVKAIEAIHGHGSMGVELFLTKDGRVLVNELAPRVHNSGHYTIEACECSQFENHIRAITGLPLGSTEMIKPHAVMVNLIGDGNGPGEPRGYEDALRVPGAQIHIYGKSESRKGRKMGHVTALGNTEEEAMTKAEKAANLIRFGNI